MSAPQILVTVCDDGAPPQSDRDAADDGGGSGPGVSSPVALEPLEKEWLQAAAGGHVATLSHLLQQDPTLASKKDFTSVSVNAVLDLVLWGSDPQGAPGWLSCPMPGGSFTMRFRQTQVSEKIKDFLLNSKHCIHYQASTWICHREALKKRRRDSPREPQFAGPCDQSVRAGASNNSTQTFRFIDS
ncbi:uncharacterized protein LOC144324875 [Podarcis muralis]